MELWHLAVKHNQVSQLHPMLSEPLDYCFICAIVLPQYVNVSQNRFLLFGNTQRKIRQGIEIKHLNIFVIKSNKLKVLTSNRYRKF